MCSSPKRRKPIGVLIVSTLLSIILSAALLAENPPKTYPEEGKVIGTGLNQLERTRTYKVATETKTYELDCGKHPAPFSRTPGECGGDKKLQIGDVVHFRIEKGKACIPVPATVESSGEQRLRILREELKPAAAKADSKPGAEKQ
ncbi:MAG TPA: hypothetical protein VNW47_05295 [Terriglobales bacterium]|jgi:hypothetical protein|nr:hypothetical protein [Terriglobales bacterium]